MAVLKVEKQVQYICSKTGDEDSNTGDKDMQYICSNTGDEGMQQ